MAKINMNAKISILFLGGIITCFLATGISWLLTNETSPLDDYLLWHPRLRNLWGMLNFPSYLAGALAKGNSHNIDELVAWAVFLIQWTLVGIIITAIYSNSFRRRIM